MENEVVYKPIIKKFLGYNVRVVQVDKRKEYIICKDMFDVLGLVRGNGIWTDAKNKMLEFLEGINESDAYETFVVMLKEHGTKRKYVKREVECLNIETAPIVLTQFQPTKRRGEEALNKWFKFMEFVNMLLKYHECHKYIIDDKERYKITMKEIKDNGGIPQRVNVMIAEIMGKLITGEDNFSIKKDELKIYQPQTTIDLLEVRNFVLDKFSTCYVLTGHHDKARDLTLKLAQKKYFNK